MLSCNKKRYLFQTVNRGGVEAAPVKRGDIMTLDRMLYIIVFVAAFVIIFYDVFLYIVQKKQNKNFVNNVKKNNEQVTKSNCKNN